MFYAKSDIEVADSVLRKLAISNIELARARTPIIADLLASRIGAVDELFPLPTQGTFHVVHGVRLKSGLNLVVRSSVAAVRAVDDRMEIEPRIFPMLERMGVPCPAIVLAAVGAARIAPFDLLVMERVRGERFADAADQDRPELLAAIGRFLKRVHQLGGINGFGPVALPVEGGVRGALASWPTYVHSRLGEHIAYCVTYGMLSPGDGRKAQGFFEVAQDEVPMRSCLLHADLGGHNIFVEDDRVCAIIDWEDAVIGDPVFDLAMWATFQPRRRHRPFLEGYGAPRGDAAFERAFKLYFLRIVLAKAVHRHRFGYSDSPGRATINQRLAEALEGLAAVS